MYLNCSLFVILVSHNCLQQCKTDQKKKKKPQKHFYELVLIMSISPYIDDNYNMFNK